MKHDPYKYTELILPRDSDKITTMIELIEKMVNRTYFSMIDDGIAFCKFNYLKNDDDRRFHVPKNMKFLNLNDTKNSPKTIKISLINPEYDAMHYSNYVISVSSDMTLYLHVDVFNILTNEKVFDISTSFSAYSNHTGKYKSSEAFMEFQKIIYKIWNSILDINISLCIHDSGIKCLTQQEYNNSSFMLGRFNINDSKEA